MSTENTPASLPEESTPPALQIEIRPNGALVIRTDCQITHSDGTVEIKTGTSAFCRCGASSKKPFCDGSHRTIEFKG